MMTFDISLEFLSELVVQYGLRLLGSIIIFLVGRWLSRVLSRALARLLNRSAVDGTLVRFLTNIAYYALLVVTVIAALQNLGFSTTSVVAVLGAASLAVGLALQDSLANFAAGVMIILFRPFRVGDLVDAGGAFGRVQEVRIFNTVLSTLDNRRVIVPNGKIISDSITNHTVNGTLRVDMVFGIGYEDDIRQARRIFEEILAEDERVLAEPAPTVAVLELADSSVNFAVRPFVQAADYWPVRFSVTEQV